MFGAVNSGNKTNMNRFVLFSFLLLVYISHLGSCQYCNNWTLCQVIRCVAPPDPCPKDKPYLLYSECGCCQYCSETPRVGPCGTCGVDVICRTSSPICRGKNSTVTLDHCGCCKTCKRIVGVGEKCAVEGPSFVVCAATLRCIDNVCVEPVVS